MTRLLHGAVGYNDPALIGEILGDNTNLKTESVKELAAGTATLTIREQQVLAYAAQTKTNHEIGRDLGIAEATVKRHMRNIFAKLDATSRMDAIRKAGLSVQLP